MRGNRSMKEMNDAVMPTQPPQGRGRPRRLMGSHNSQPTLVTLGVWAPAYVRGELNVRNGRCLLDEKILDPGITCFPVHPDPIINQISAAVYEHRWKHVGVNIILVVKIRFVIFVFKILFVVFRFAVGVLFIILSNCPRFNRVLRR